MSTEIHEGSIFVTRFVGPDHAGQDRARWQFTLPYDGMQRGFVTLRRDEVVVLAAALANSAAEVGAAGKDTAAA